MLDRLPALMVAVVLSLQPSAALGQARFRVVATLPTYASIARELTGDLAEITAIARGDEDPHFVTPRPSFAALLQRADVFIVTGLDLELWVPALLDRANNPKVVEGAAGHIAVSDGIGLLDVPQSLSRAGGDIHVFGNPHVHTDPINGILIARNIAGGLKRVDPSHAAVYDANLAKFEDRVLRRLFGDRLVDLLGGDVLFALGRDNRFWDFAQSQKYGGRPLTEYVGGWLAQGAVFRDRRVVCYHKNWAYFSARFRMECAMYIEPKPGIPPSPGHVREVIDFIRSENIPVVFAANFFNRSQVDQVAARTGATAVVAPEHVGGEADVDDYFTLIDRWVGRLVDGFRAHATAAPPQD